MKHPLAFLAAILLLVMPIRKSVQAHVALDHAPGLNYQTIYPPGAKTSAPTAAPASPFESREFRVSSGGLGNNYTWLLPDLQTLPPFDLHIQAAAGGSQKLLRFSNAIWNRGPGPLEFHGLVDEDEDTILITQMVYRLNGSGAGRRVGTSVFHAGHDHWHFEGFATYEIWSVSEVGELLEVLVTSGKVSYCARDDRRVAYAELGLPDLEGNYPGRLTAVYTGCIWSFQGMSVGWQDIYRHHLPDQDVDITGLPNGIYALRSSANPQRLILEADLENNTNFVYFYLEGDSVRVLE